ncbi:MAG: neutral zinc metallopeptidase [Armatimonadetes bacterium]|nr:neutral zinc metallopeptidase [Armatimonadota bacterium]
MRWEDREESTNIEDRRGMTGGRVAGIGGVGLIVVLAYSLLTGQNPMQVLNQVSGSSPTSASGEYQPTPHEEELRKFTAVTLKDTETVWHDIFRQLGREYVEPKLVMFTQQVESGCGVADAGMGPFYCGNDEKVYIDLSFYDMMKQKFGANGDFAQAYVIAHEVGHHVQKQLGTLDQVHAKREQMSDRQYNQLSVRLELQADFYAGVWAHHAKQLASLDRKDLESALNAANAIGDDALQKKMQGYVVPDAFTHGTSEQRARWFLKGWETGDVRQGDTFSVRNL